MDYDDPTVFYDSSSSLKSKAEILELDFDSAGTVLVGGRPVQPPSELSDLPGDDQVIEEDEPILEMKNVYSDAENELGAMEKVIERDERLQVSPSLSQPYRWICYLRLKFKGGRVYQGTGFFFRPNKKSTGCILTCAHNLFTHQLGVATEVQIVPARDGDRAPFGVTTVGPESFRYSEKYEEKPGPEFDYGMIMMPKEKRSEEPYGFGYVIMKKRMLSDRIVQVCGYPFDKPRGSMWLAGGQVSGISRNSFSYVNDTAAGQSGAPIWTWARYNWIVVGIHGWGYEDRNAACRMKKHVIDDVNKWIKELE